MQRFMTGRYGYDELGHDLNIVAIVLLILSLFETLRPLNLFAMALWLWVVFRMYSRKTHKRMIERDHYLRWRKKIAGRFSTAKRAWSDRKTHRYFRCKSCGAVLRVPKGKGKVTVTCPQCGNEITKKT